MYRATVLCHRHIGALLLHDIMRPSVAVKMPATRLFHGLHSQCWSKALVMKRVGERKDMRL